MMSREMVISVAGGVLVLGCGWLLAFVLGLAGMATQGLDGPAYWREMLSKILGFDYGGRVTWPALFGLLIGMYLIICAFRRAGSVR